MALSITKLKILQELVKKKLPYKGKKKWLAIFSDEVGIGDATGDTVEFDVRDIEAIKSYLISNNYSLESTSESFSDRIEASKNTGDEKISDSPVTQDRMLAMVMSGEHLLDNQRLPVGRVFDITIEELLSLNLRKVVVVENLAVFYRLAEYKELLSIVEDCSMFVFRGTRGIYSTTAPKKFCSGCFSGVRVGWFYYDPAGLNLTGNKHFDSVIVPTIKFMKINKESIKDSPHLFYKQDHHKAPVSSNLQEHFDFMMKNQFAITQEHMLAIDMPVEEIRL